MQTHQGSFTWGSLIHSWCYLSNLLLQKHTKKKLLSKVFSLLSVLLFTGQHKYKQSGYLPFSSHSLLKPWPTFILETVPNQNSVMVVGAKACSQFFFFSSGLHMSLSWSNKTLLPFNLALMGLHLMLSGIFKMGTRWSSITRSHAVPQTPFKSDFLFCSLHLLIDSKVSTRSQRLKLPLWIRCYTPDQHCDVTKQGSKIMVHNLAHI